MRTLLILLLSMMLIRVTAQLKDLSATDVLSGNSIALADYHSKKGVVVIFTGNLCPYALYYEKRITQLVADYADDLQFILVNSHKEQGESEPLMKRKITEWGIDIPYLSDKDQTIKTALNARKSPEVYLLVPDAAGGFTVYYSGAIDNNPQVAGDVKDPYLKNSIENLLTGKPPTVRSIRPIGCTIR